ncbi:MAG: hypothetical protein K8S62_08405 [Candidatus Sabulitectum sp.]|nr:hypothetical protein [Candidatus Sabulitectum sp.]
MLSEGYKLDSLQHFYSSLIQAFQDDVPKYSTGASMRRVIAHCLESTPLYTGSRIKFAGFGSSNYRSREVGEAMRRGMLLQLVYPTSEVTPPAKPNLRKHPKLFSGRGGGFSPSTQRNACSHKGKVRPHRQTPISAQLHRPMSTRICG